MAFGSLSIVMADMCAAKQAHVEDRGKGRYGRAIGVVTCAGVEANSEQVRRGYAWVFVKYASKDSPLYELQAAARSRRAGLWADPRPIAPWDWRAAQRAAARRP